MDFYSRRSIRKYEEKEVEEHKIGEILRAALVSPTGKNKKPYELIVVKDKKILEALSNCKSKGGLFLKDAPLGIVVIGLKDMSDTWIEDCSIVSTFIQLKAHELGLGSCWVQMRGRMDKVEKPSEILLKKILDTPENSEILSVIALGYPEEERPSHGKADMDFSKIKLNTYKNNYFDK